MVVFDASVLLFLLDESTNGSVDRAKDRVDYLVQRLTKSGDKVIVPTPALSECLVNAGEAGPTYLAILDRNAAFRVASFDARAAVEAAVRTAAARQRGLRKGGQAEAPKSKIKFDRQIVAIASVEGASAVYSDDGDVCAYAREAGMEAFMLADLPLPPEDAQKRLFDDDAL